MDPYDDTGDVEAMKAEGRRLLFWYDTAVYWFTATVLLGAAACGAKYGGLLDLHAMLAAWLLLYASGEIPVLAAKRALREWRAECDERFGPGDVAGSGHVPDTGCRSASRSGKTLDACEGDE
jgi:hypothetical protein